MVVASNAFIIKELKEEERKKGEKEGLQRGTVIGELIVTRNLIEILNIEEVAKIVSLNIETIKVLDSLKKSNVGKCGAEMRIIPPYIDFVFVELFKNNKELLIQALKSILNRDDVVDVEYYEEERENRDRFYKNSCILLGAKLANSEKKLYIEFKLMRSYEFNEIMESFQFLRVNSNVRTEDISINIASLNLNLKNEKVCFESIDHRLNFFKDFKAVYFINPNANDDESVIEKWCRIFGINEKEFLYELYKISTDEINQRRYDKKIESFLEEANSLH